jgi:hypothetical protein
MCTSSFKPIFWKIHSRNVSIATVQRASTVAQDLPLHCEYDVGSVSEHFNGIDIARGVGMTMISSNHRAIFTAAVRRRCVRGVSIVWDLP